MLGFIKAIVLSIAGGVAAAFLVEAAPLPVLRVALTMALGAVVLFAARVGAPGAPVLSHLFGLGFAALALAANWVFWLLLLADYDHAALLAALGETPETWIAYAKALSEERGIAVGGRVIESELLRGFWIGHAVWIGLAGFFGGQSRYVEWRTKRRARRGH